MNYKPNSHVRFNYLMQRSYCIYILNSWFFSYLKEMFSSALKQPIFSPLQDTKILTSNRRGLPINKSVNFGIKGKPNSCYDLNQFGQSRSSDAAKTGPKTWDIKILQPQNISKLSKWRGPPKWPISEGDPQNDQFEKGPQNDKWGKGRHKMTIERSGPLRSG